MSGRGHAVPEGWVPVEDRLYGLDRRSLLPAAVIVLAGLVLAVVLPLADRSTTGHESVRAGDRLNLGDGLTIAPPVGWQILDGIKVGTKTTVPVTDKAAAAVTDGGVTATIQVDTFHGDAHALLNQVNHNETHLSDIPGFAVTSGRRPVVATGGITGLQETYTSTSGDGIVAAFTFTDGRGMSVLVTGPGDGQLAERIGRIERMLRSVTLKAQP